MGGVENALRALSVCKETLGKVKVVFAHAKRFWDLVRISADELNEAVNVANMIGEDTREKSDLEAIREEMFKSAQGWAAMGHMNYHANLCLQGADQKADELMNYLPTGDESLDEILKLKDFCAAKISAQSTRLQDHQVALKAKSDMASLMLEDLKDHDGGEGI